MKTRFCPSPTGLIHLGNARTALFNGLLAVGHQGKFLLRIEDTDLARSEKRFVEALQIDLQWLGLQWQEGPEVGGNAGPYWQSERHAIYEKYYQILQEKGRAYPCFCTEQQLAVSRKLQRVAGKAPRYAGTCRSLKAEEVAAKLAAGQKPVLRFLVPQGGIVEFEDLVKGKLRFEADDIGDFIIRRADGGAAFMYCNAIDDALMEVTHALRGEDHLTNTPRQIMILQALGLKAPQYGHISLIMGQDGSPLSKRNGSRSVQDLRDEGYLPLAIVNYLARLGHYYANNSFLSFAQLAKQFELANLSKSPARFDPTQLLFWQKQAVAALTDAEFWQWIGAETQKLVPEQLQQEFIHLLKPNCQFAHDAMTWAKAFFDDLAGFDIEEATILHQAGAEFFQHAIETVQHVGIDFKLLADSLQQKLNVKGKALFMPLRIALTGKQHGPEMAGVMKLLGKEKILQRLQNALAHVRK